MDIAESAKQATLPPFYFLVFFVCFLCICEFQLDMDGSVKLFECVKVFEVEDTEVLGSFNGDSSGEFSVYSN